MKEKKPLGRPKGTTIDPMEKKERVVFVIKQKVIEHFGIKEMRKETIEYWTSRYNEEHGE